MAGTLRQMMARRRSSAVNEYVEAMKNTSLEKVSVNMSSFKLYSKVHSRNVYKPLIPLYTLRYVEKQEKFVTL